MMPEPEQSKQPIKMPFGDVKEKSEIKRAKSEAEKIFREGMANILDLIAPAAFNINPNYIELEGYYVRSMFVYTYPRYLQTNWLSPVIDYDITCDISMYIYPLKSAELMPQLKRKVGELESTQTIEQEKGYVRNPELETAITDIEGLRDVLPR